MSDLQRILDNAYEHIQHEAYNDALSSILEAKELSKDMILMPQALTAENGAKALLMGEFKESRIMTCEHCDNGLDYDDGCFCEYCNGSGDYKLSIEVTWSTIKDVYKMAVEFLSK